MKTLAPSGPFQPGPPDAAGIISWVHLGDLHMTRAGEQNHLDLAEIVNELNQAWAGSLSFVFVPGDVADDGSRAAYTVVRGELDRLRLPWCAIVGDHDVHEKSLKNFLEAMSGQAHYAFTVGNVRFVAMNAFDVPDPASFAVKKDQMDWVRGELQAATGESKVLLLHCYPSDLKSGGDELIHAIRHFDVKLIDMGHTHYNELANDGKTIYSATRSTGQIEEGRVGYSVTNLDGSVVSWRFVERGRLPVVVITSPGDERLLTSLTAPPQAAFKVRAKFWGNAVAVRATAGVAGKHLAMRQIENSCAWEAEVSSINEGVHTLMVSVEDANGKVATDEIRIVIGDRVAQERAERDQDNAIGAWPEHGLLGTQLGPNKNGKKW